MDAIINAVTDRSFQIAFLVSIAAVGTIFTVLEPFLVKDKLKERLASVGSYRENLRQQQRDALSKKAMPTLRTNSPQGAVKQLVDNLKLLEVFDAESARKKLMMAGHRSQGAVFTFMAARIGMPFVMAILVAIYVFLLNGVEADNFGKLLFCIGGFLAGFHLPNLYINNAVGKRQTVIRAAWPDALDLLLICVESGMSIEVAFQKVGQEVGASCPELAEELGLTTAELSYLQDRKEAYGNLADRTGLDVVKGVATALTQSEKYGTPLGQALRIMATESRELRMQEAEKKAAALPPKLTVPMIGFFLPVLFAVILSPAIMGIMGME